AYLRRLDTAYVRPLGGALLALVLSVTTLHAQEPGLKLAVGDFGIGIGDVPR
ncbi:MAG: hypothetical protein GWN71_00155, partial [Gammaproteobacteria bacterium]|nr:hypothetical protein [Gemmatimonadota bacterium]NIU72037.1 hypothetical protein [Gammaproteobacteria bacterium]